MPTGLVGVRGYGVTAKLGIGPNHISRNNYDNDS